MKKSMMTIILLLTIQLIGCNQNNNANLSNHSNENNNNKTEIIADDHPIITLNIEELVTFHSYEGNTINSDHLLAYDFEDGKYIYYFKNGTTLSITKDIQKEIELYNFKRINESQSLFKEVMMAISLSNGEEFEFVNAVKGGSVPRDRDAGLEFCSEISWRLSSHHMDISCCTLFRHGVVKEREAASR